MSSTSKFSAVPAFVAALSLTVTPAAAADVPVAAPQVSAVAVSPAWTPENDKAENRRWSRHRYDRYDRYHRRDRIDTGDVLAGVLILGGIAAIASAASRSNRDNDRTRDDYRYRDRGDYRQPGSDDYRYRDRQDSRGSWGNDGEARGLNNAVEMCVREIERDQRVDSVNSVDRNGRGWTVTGSLFNGAGFTCSIGEDGRIENVDTGGGAYRSGAAVPVPSGEDRQWDDDRYAAERARVESDGGTVVAQGPQPAYPGGPLPGMETVDPDLDAGTADAS